MDKTVRRSDVLREMDVHEDSAGKRSYFSISFYKKDGELGFEVCDFLYDKN